jgi:sugar/nucleoside kinase (ribokinase family)
VVGTLVWDTIHARDGRTSTVEEWGGIAYGLAAATVAVPAGWEVVPVIKVGRDLSERALRFLRGIPGLDCETGIQVVPEPNNRVDLRYGEEGRRTEKLSGGVPPWEWADLGPVVRSCDALYVNFISGFEMGLDAARSLRAAFPGPTYADLHSLFLGIGREGLRIPRRLPSPDEWLRCFDAVQMNEDEFDLLGRAWGDPWKLAAEVVGPELKLVTVTLGDRGAAYVAGPGFVPRPERWPATRHLVGVSGPSRSGRVAVEAGHLDGDPTGCGDVWGATFFCRLLHGDVLEEAMGRANAAASRNVSHRGARGLHRHLRGRIVPG